MSTSTKLTTEEILSLGLTEDDREMLEMYIEKISRPGRLNARVNMDPLNEDPLENNSEFFELIYELLKDSGEKPCREAALLWIKRMSGIEFQDRLFKGTLPEFEREQYPEFINIERQTCHPFCKLTDKQFDLGMTCQGDIKRHHLRYCSTDEYKTNYYY